MQYEAHFNGLTEFQHLFGSSFWKSLGAEIYNRKCYVPGALYGATPYALNDAAKLCAFALHTSRTDATRAAVLYHFNYPE